MKELLIFRHAKSSRDDPSLADHERPLNKRGIKTAPQMGRFIKEKNLCPDAIVSSDALRARQTADLFAENCGYKGKIELTRAIYEANVKDMIGLIKKFDSRRHRMMVVGHNPTFEELSARLTGTDEIFPTAAIAHITLPIDDWSELSEKTKGKLAGLWRPKELK